MPNNATQICPHCGNPLHEQKAGHAEKQSAQDSRPAPEYDHRGILMPRRTKIGGIIIPQ